MIHIPRDQFPLPLDVPLSKDLHLAQWKITTGAAREITKRLQNAAEDLAERKETLSELVSLLALIPQDLQPIAREVYPAALAAARQSLDRTQDYIKDAIVTREKLRRKALSEIRTPPCYTQKELNKTAALCLPIHWAIESALTGVYKIAGNQIVQFICIPHSETKRAHRILIDLKNTTVYVHDSLTNKVLAENITESTTSGPSIIRSAALAITRYYSENGGQIFTEI